LPNTVIPHAKCGQLAGTHGDTHIYVLSGCDAASALVKARRPVVDGVDAGHSQRHIVKILYIRLYPIRLASWPYSGGVLSL